jgi:hypothetical protein
MTRTELEARTLEQQQQILDLRAQLVLQGVELRRLARGLGLQHRYATPTVRELR